MTQKLLSEKIKKKTKAIFVLFACRRLLFFACLGIFTVHWMLSGDCVDASYCCSPSQGLLWVNVILLQLMCIPHCISVGMCTCLWEGNCVLQWSCLCYVMITLSELKIGSPVDLCALQPKAASHKNCKHNHSIAHHFVKFFDSYECACVCVSVFKYVRVFNTARLFCTTILQNWKMRLLNQDWQGQWARSAVLSNGSLVLYLSKSFKDWLHGMIDSTWCYISTGV